VFDEAFAVSVDWGVSGAVRCPISLKWRARMLGWLSKDDHVTMRLAEELDVSNDIEKDGDG